MLKNATTFAFYFHHTEDSTSTEMSNMQIMINGHNMWRAVLVKIILDSNIKIR